MSGGVGDGGESEANEEFEAAAARIAQLAQEFENLPYPNLRDKAVDLLQAVDALHRAPLERLMRLLGETGQDDLVGRLTGDPLVHQLLVLYDLLPCDDRTQVESALHSFGEYAHAHGGTIEVEDVVEGVVSVRVSGACLACSRSTSSLSRAMEETLRREYPAFGSLEIRGESSGDAATVMSEDACQGCK